MRREPALSEAESTEYAYLKIPPEPRLRACPGLVLAGMATRARVGADGLEDAAEVLASVQSVEEPTHFRFSMNDDGVVVEVEDVEPEGWRTVVELLA